MKTLQTDVWQLELEAEEIGQEDLIEIVDDAIKGNRKAQNYLKKLWDEKWLPIKEKLLTDGSVWYVWWMDGVRQHLRNGIERSDNG